MASGTGSPMLSAAMKSTNPPTVIYSPWAKLIMFTRPYTSVKPMAPSATHEPSTIPNTMSWAMVI